MSQLRYWLRHQPAFLRIVVFMIGVVLCAAPIAVPIYFYEVAAHAAAVAQNPEAATQGPSIIWAPLCLVIVLIMGFPWWLRQIHGVRHPWRRLGFTGGITWFKHWAYAFGLGVMSVTGLYAIQLILGWSAWVGLGDRWFQFAVEGWFLGFGVGVAEELLFRGWLLFELEQDYRPYIVVGFNAFLFAIAHYFRPLDSILATWPQFVGLVLLGVTLVWARRIPVKLPRLDARTHLGFAAGLHGGLVWAYYQVDVGDLVATTAQVPTWITGIDHNPLAGCLGLCLLAGLASLTYRLSHRNQPSRV